jgi:hypothetical protein
VSVERLLHACREHPGIRNDKKESREQTGIRNDKKERSRADRLEVVESCIGWKEWHMRDLSLRGADRSVTVVCLTRKRRSNLGWNV